MKKDKDYRKDFGWLGIYATRNWRYRHCSFQIEYTPWSSSRRHLRITLSFPWLFFIHLKIRFPKFKKIKDEYCVFSLSFHNSSFWWDFGTKTGEWSSSTPKWRKGCFHFDDFFLGKSKHSMEDESQCDRVRIDMPEGFYHANVKTWTSVWRRPRWFTKRLRRIEFEIPIGIPIEGKGENSWDCGMDCVFTTTMPLKDGDIYVTARKMAISMLKDRQRRGGLSHYSMETLKNAGYTKAEDGEILKVKTFEVAVEDARGWVGSKGE